MWGKGRLFPLSPTKVYLEATMGVSICHLRSPKYLDLAVFIKDNSLYRLLVSAPLASRTFIFVGLEKQKNNLNTTLGPM